MNRLDWQWKNLMKLCDVDHEVYKAIYADIKRHYNAEKRFYHNLSHIAHVLQIIIELKDLASNLPVVQLAAWFHDIIYDPQKDDNEKLSAEYGQEALRNMNLSTAIIRPTKALIRATKRHRAPKGDIDAAILLDADLAILAADSHNYSSYKEAIEKEYSWLPAKIYRSERVRILQNFLDRKRIFFTKPMFERCEARARRNLIQEIEMLTF